MDKKTMFHTVSLLFLISAIIYGLQIILFHDPETTAFYIFQDLAFMPATIAIATLVVGDLISAREKRERLEKTRMLTSTFYTELGTRLTRILLETAEPREQLAKILTLRCGSDADLTVHKKKIREMPLKIHITKDVFDEVRGLILGSRTSLMVLSSNPLLFEHEEFTELLWAVFHLIDEFQLRGPYDALSEADIAHFNRDLEQTYRLLLCGYISNAKYLRETYPNLFEAAAKKIRHTIDE